MTAKILGFIVHRSIVAGNTLAVTTSQTTQQSIFITGAAVLVTLAVAVAFYKLQQRCWSRIHPHLYWFEPLNILTFVEYPAPLGWIKIIAQPGLNLVVHSVAVVSCCITGGWEGFGGGYIDLEDTWLLNLAALLKSYQGYVQAYSCTKLPGGADHAC